MIFNISGLLNMKYGLLCNMLVFEVLFLNLKISYLFLWMKYWYLIFYVLYILNNVVFLGNMLVKYLMSWNFYDIFMLFILWFTIDMMLGWLIIIFSLKFLIMFFVIFEKINLSSLGFILNLFCIFICIISNNLSFFFLNYLNLCFYFLVF